jgi:hypothetical protein
MSDTATSLRGIYDWANAIPGATGRKDEAGGSIPIANHAILLLILPPNQPTFRGAMEGQEQ